MNNINYVMMTFFNLKVKGFFLIFILRLNLTSRSSKVLILNTNNNVKAIYYLISVFNYVIVQSCFCFNYFAKSDLLFFFCLFEKRLLTIRKESITELRQDSLFVKDTSVGNNKTTPIDLMKLEWKKGVDTSSSPRNIRIIHKDEMNTFL